MTTIDTDLYVLTAQDARALRNADSICFDLTREGVHKIRAIQRAEDSSTGFEQTHTIPCSGRLDDYTGHHDAGPPVGFHMVMSAKYDSVAQTLVRRMRPGNVVVLRWVRGNASPVTREIGFVRDELYLATGKPDTRAADHFLVAVYAGYDNTARMVRRA